MLKFISVSGSVRAITDITLTGTLIRTGPTPDLIIDPITGHSTGTAAIVIYRNHHRYPYRYRY
jgi:hypothetical protein